MMAWYVFQCDECRGGQEVCCLHSQLERMTPVCCGNPMNRDFRAERFGGVSYRSKGKYPMHDEMQGVTHESYQAHERWIKDNGLVRREQPREQTYRIKHRGDRVQTEARLERERR